MSREEMKKVRLNYEKRKNRTNHCLVEGMIMKMRPTGWCQTSEAMGVRAPKRCDPELSPSRPAAASCHLR